MQRQLFELKSAEVAANATATDEESTESLVMGKKSRLIVVSNRLPVTRVVNADGSCGFTLASGGLVTALSGVKTELDFVWVGWVGCEIPVEEQAMVGIDRGQLFNCMVFRCICTHH